MHHIRLEKISKRYAEADKNILQDISLSISTKQWLVITGPSGIGKTTLLNLISLLDSPSHGDMYINNDKIQQLSDTNRHQLRANMFGYVLQFYKLVPHLNVYDNIALALHYRGRSQTVKQQVHDILSHVELVHLAKKRPGQLSGGQCQRVALARALVVKPHFLILDEPFSALDTNTARRMIKLIQQFQKENDMGVIMVTHDTTLLPKNYQSFDMN